MGAWPEDVDRIVLEDVDSTNKEALRLIAAGAAKPAWILAHRQTAGRGRRGRPWDAEAGNFTASLMIRPDLPLARFAELSFVAALALRDTVETLVPDARATLKWPNDVLLVDAKGSPRKLSGILLETSGPWLVVGIGVNLRSSPPKERLEPDAMPPIALSDVSETRIAPEPFLDTLAAAFARLANTHRSLGFSPIRTSWLASAHGLGDSLVARTGTSTHEGRFEEIDETGALVLATSKGRLVLPAADVYFGPS